MARVTYRKGTESFVNPYHFVPLGKECDRKYDYKAIKEQSGLLTGWIECELETKSPVFIPNSSNDDVFQTRAGNEEVKSYDFFSREDLSGCFKPSPPASPVIPGSELRGVFRSAFEAVTNSCMSTTDDESVLFKRTTIPGHPGIVKHSDDGKWYLQPCQERIGLAAWRRYRKTHNEKDNNDFSAEIDASFEGKEIIFDRSTNKYRNSKGVEVFFVATSFGSGGSKGFLHKGESIFNKHHESIFVPDTRKAGIPLSERDLENLVHNYRLYGDEKVNQSLAAGKHNGYESFLKKAKKRNADDLELEDMKNALVYYKQIGDCIYLCPAAIGREVFHRRLRDLIGSFAPCEKSNSLCPACALFGFVAGKESVAGRVRFSDAEFINQENSSKLPFLDAMVLPELASPKPSATEFYLERPSENADLWNYDYAGTWKGKDLVSFPKYRAQIRGRKFYWHGGKVRNLENPSDRMADEKISKRHVKVRPLREGVFFRFKVHFDEITEKELQKLLWVLSIGNSGEYGHKIGMGKPVGLGSFAVRADGVFVRSAQISEDGSVEYEILSRRDLIDSVMFVGKNEKEKTELAALLLGGDLESLKAFLRISKLKNDFAELIDYPRLDPQIPDSLKNKHAAFHWFVGNKQIAGTGGIGVKPVIDQVLPHIDEPRLKRIKAEQQQGWGNRR